MESKPVRVKVDEKRWPGVYKLELKQDVTYHITYRLGRRKVWEKVGSRSEGFTPQLAASIRAERMRKALHGEEVKTAREIQRERLEHDRTLGEIASHYFEHEGAALKGLKTDKNRWRKHLAPTFEKRRVSELTPLDVARLKRDMKEKAPATVWNAVELLRRLCNYGRKHGLAPALPFTIEMPKRDNEIVEYLEPEDLRRLLTVLDSWPRQDVARMLRVALFSGMRRGEIFRLEDRDLDFRHGVVTIRAPKGGKTATIPMPDTLAEIFRAQREWRRRVYPDSAFVFPGQGGGRRVDCGAVDRIKARAELPKTFRVFHGLRHHFAVKLANSGAVGLDMLAELLTHKSTAMTKRYGQFLPETKRAAADLAAGIILSDAEPAEPRSKVVNIEEARK